LLLWLLAAKKKSQLLQHQSLKPQHQLQLKLQQLLLLTLLLRPLPTLLLLLPLLRPPLRLLATLLLPLRKLHRLLSNLAPPQEKEPAFEPAFLRLPLCNAVRNRAFTCDTGEKKAGLARSQLFCSGGQLPAARASTYLS